MDNKFEVENNNQVLRPENHHQTINKSIKNATEIVEKLLPWTKPGTKKIVEQISSNSVKNLKVSQTASSQI